MEYAPEQLFAAILLLPLVSAALIALFFRRSGNLAAVASVGSAALVCVLSLLAVFKGVDGSGQIEDYFASIEWMRFGSFQLSLGLYYNEMTALMLFVVGFVGFLIHVFSVGYMHDDEAKGRYFGGLSIFMFSMLGIVLADNLLMIFIFWELVGFSSYMLIAHYWKTEEAREACKKAFIMNRVGDLGMLIGIIWCYWNYQTVNIPVLEKLVAEDPSIVHTGIGLLLICGFIGKSAQFPLHTWLPDAMAGPTPVSALIHAATMVAAGIYFLCRIFVLLDPTVLEVITWLGAIMAVYAGFCAFAQTDIKRILAYSTLSQLGYMAVAVGLGFPHLALFHTATHAFFKALLFLGSGSVIHACHHEQDIYKMGGLLKRMPLTGITFLIGTAALAGVTMTSGWFSKDAILEAAYLNQSTIFYLVTFGAFLTSAYMGRLYWIAFLGKPRSDHAAHAKESNLFMVVPLILLAALSIGGGVIATLPKDLAAEHAPAAEATDAHHTDYEALRFSGIAESLHNVHHEIEEADAKSLFFGLGIATWAVGFAVSFVFWRPGAKDDALQQKLPVVYSFLKARLWFDEIYEFYTRQIQQRLAEFLHFLDVLLISGLLVRGSAGMAGLIGLLARSLHVGNIQAYLYWFLLGALIYGAYALNLLH